MKKNVLLLLCIAMALIPSQKTKAWGPEGHKMVVDVAMQFLKPDVKNNVLAILDTMSTNTAGNWMDIMRSNSDYDFMKPWHYIDFPAEQEYQPSTDENIVNRLIITFNELRHKRVLCSQQVKTDMLILMHLLGDLHQPLHTGYDDDLGGNKVAIQYDTLKTNLHHFWDDDIIRIANISLQDCMNLYQSNNKADTIDGIHPALWMKETRSNLKQVYNKNGFMLTDAYVKKGAEIIKRQILVAGLRLAAMLNKLFYDEAPVIDMKAEAAKYKDGIDAKDAVKYIGKKVTACGRVFGIKSTDKVTFMNVGDKYPNSPLTVVIFEKDKGKFQPSIEELFADKNICIKGEVVEYKGKAEIIVAKPEDIIVL
jgi:hypothetical protein